MLHVTCDLCGRELQHGEDHFVVKIEVFATGEPGQLTEADLDADHMEAVGELLRELEEEVGEAAAPVEPPSRRLRYDLCPECRGRYLRDPLHKEATAPPRKEPAQQKFGFSEN
jgi:hypothetical protein